MKDRAGQWVCAIEYVRAAPLDSIRNDVWITMPYRHWPDIGLLFLPRLPIGLTPGFIRICRRDALALEVLLQMGFSRTGRSRNKKGLCKLHIELFFALSANLG